MSESENDLKKRLAALEKRVARLEKQMLKGKTKKAKSARTRSSFSLGPLEEFIVNKARLTALAEQYAGGNVSRLVKLLAMDPRQLTRMVVNEPPNVEPVIEPYTGSTAYPNIQIMLSETERNAVQELADRYAGGQQGRLVQMLADGTLLPMLQDSLL